MIHIDVVESIHNSFRITLNLNSSKTCFPHPLQAYINSLQLCLKDTANTLLQRKTLHPVSTSISNHSSCSNSPQLIISTAIHVEFYPAFHGGLPRDKKALIHPLIILPNCHI
ncbi:hypothetical protein ACOSP7_028917 [Xanthoceras sorbifolium]